MCTGHRRTPNPRPRILNRWHLQTLCWIPGPRVLPWCLWVSLFVSRYLTPAWLGVPRPWPTPYGHLPPSISVVSPDICPLQTSRRWGRWRSCAGHYVDVPAFWKRRKIPADRKAALDVISDYIKNVAIYLIMTLYLDRCYSKWRRYHRNDVTCLKFTLWRR